MPERKAVERGRARVRDMLHTLPPQAQQAIRDDLERSDTATGLARTGAEP
jgi:phospholipid/cholesterol/gamma-HCH transport system ATP-binding protein